MTLPILHALSVLVPISNARPSLNVPLIARPAYLKEFTVTFPVLLLPATETSLTILPLLTAILVTFLYSS
jgi:hypothetical protein